MAEYELARGMLEGTCPGSQEHVDGLISDIEAVLERASPGIRGYTVLWDNEGKDCLYGL